MKKQVWGIVAVIAGLAVLVGGVATASNMGFKFVPSMQSGKAYNLSLPWNNNYTNAESIFSDVGGLDRVARVTTSGGYSSWLGLGNGGDNFPVAKGEAYVLFTAAALLPPTPVVVGSHDPNYTYNFPTGAYNAAAPYHQTYQVAQDLFAALGTSCPTQLDRVARVDDDTAAFVSWLGLGNGGDNFPMTLGKGVVVFMTAPCNGFVWAHY